MKGKREGERGSEKERNREGERGNQREIVDERERECEGVRVSESV